MTIIDNHTLNELAYWLGEGNQKIQAIKTIRMLTNLGLKDAKDLADRVTRGRPLVADEVIRRLVDELADVGVGTEALAVGDLVITPTEQLAPSDTLTNKAILSVLTELLKAIKEQTETIKDLMEELS